ncbi:MAG: hypothetical protein QHC40_04175 [Sphingobium sp.]|nr:hypothetical protein [Sphingobium sp.]
MVIQMLQIERQARWAVIIMETHANLTTAIGRVTRIAQAVVTAIEAPDRNAQFRRQPHRRIAVDAGIAEVSAGRRQGQTWFLQGIAGQEVDAASRRIGGEDGGGATAHGLDMIDGRIAAEYLIGIKIA